MLDAAAARPLSLLVVAMLTLPLPGCSPANLFHGRLFVINSTGGVLRSPAVINSHPGLRQTLEFPDMADGQACVRDCGGDHPLVVLGDLELSYVDRTGATRTRRVPFEGEIPEYCYDDFFIEIDRNDRLHSGLLIYRNYREHFNARITTHALSAAIGLFLGWMICRRGWTMRPGRPGKSPTPEL